LDTVALMPSDPIGRARKVFEENGALFWIGGVCDIQTLRAMENNFGIAPLPKFDEAQKEYRTRTIDGWVNVVPSNARNTERTSIVMEALAVESKNYTIPAYYEVALKAKHIRDEDSERMLDLIYETRTMDMGDVVWMDNIRNVYVGEFNSKKNNFTSAVEKQLPTIEKTISKAIEAFANLP